MIRGIRGATTAAQDREDLILAATRELLEEMLAANPGCRSEDLASAIFTLTLDLRSVYPARAAREMGWTSVPLMCMQEIPVRGGLRRCIRVLLHWNTAAEQDDVRHIYLREAKALRPDLTSK
jgi:chorismate mutase